MKFLKLNKQTLMLLKHQMFNYKYPQVLNNNMLPELLPLQTNKIIITREKKIGSCMAQASRGAFLSQTEKRDVL